MTEEFDKEIDVLLRQTAQSETVSARRNPNSVFETSNSNHLDADELSAFAENALPEKARQRYLTHLADCGKCRKILSGLIALNAEQPSEVRVEEKSIVPTPIPWYRNFFAVPNLAYTMGALVLIFSGITIYTVLQNVGDSQNTEVSQTYDRQPGGKGMSSDGDAVLNESYPPDNTATSNTMTSNAASTDYSSNSAANFSAMVPAAPVASANSNAAARGVGANKDLPALAKPLTPAKEPIDSAKIEELPLNGRSVAREKEAEPQSDADEARKQQLNQTQESIAQNQTNIQPDSRDVRRAPSATMRAENKEKILGDSSSARARKPTAANFGGKTFTRTDNVWYDAAYRGQPTTNVARGTGEYRKLDSGLRAVAENLGGTVVVVWKSKVYRIQ